MAEDRRRGAVDRINSAVDTARNIRTAVSLAKTAGTAAEVVSTSEIWIPIVIVVAVILIIVFIILLGSGGTGIAIQNNRGTAPVGGIPISSGGCPDTSSNNSPSCHVLNPSIDIFNTDISQSAIDQYVNSYSPTFITAGVGDRNEFIRRVHYIIDSARFVGLNPAIFLGYWKTESLFSTYRTNAHLGCNSASPSFEADVDCAVGLSGPSVVARCAVSRDANSSPCLGVLHSNGGIHVPISKFDDFALSYGGFNSTGSSDANCTHTYNELIEVAKELGMCTPHAPVIIPSPPANIRQGLIDSFHVTMNGFDNQHLEWAWEKFWEVSNTQFTSLIAGSTIQSITLGLSAQVGCFGETSVKIKQYTPKEFFQYLLTHELGHVIANCRPSDAHVYDQRNAFDREGAVSYYAAHANTCSGSENYSEDYADMIAYYLNPSAGLSTISCHGSAPANPPNPFHGTPVLKPIHKTVVEGILGNFP